jgi:hypothetical protein
MADQQQDQQSATDDEIEAVLAILALGYTVKETAQALAGVLKLPLEVAVAFLQGIGAAALKAFTQRPGGTSARAIALRANLRYRAAFVINALRRIAAAPDWKIALKRELGFWKAHVKASQRRVTVARRIDAARRLYGDMLGWYARMDERTSAECRAADHRNFSALQPPVIGFPGSVHPHCRCIPGPPIPGAKLVDDSTTVRGADTASGFYR